MAEGNTQKFDIYIYAWDKSVSTWLSPDSVPKTISFGEQNDIKKFEYSQGKVTFYDANDNVVGDYIFDNQYKYEKDGVYLPLIDVFWNNISMNENLDENDSYIDGVPSWGGQFDVYYGSESETGDPIPETTITLSPTNLSLYVGETGTITASTNSSQSITWSSEDTAIATVNSSGVVTAISEGTTDITASIDTVTESCTVTVSAQSNYTLNIYDETNTNIMKTITIPSGDRINEYIYVNGFYSEINNKDENKDEYYISEWRNCDNDDMIPDTQIMNGNLDIYPIYTKLPTAYYSTVYLPDLTQKFPFGASGTNYPLGSTGGQEDVKLTSTQCALPRHTHDVLVDTNISSGYYIPNILPSGDNADGGAYPLVQASSSETDFTKDTSNKYKSPVVYPAKQISADNPHTNMPPYLIVNFIIKYK